MLDMLILHNPGRIKKIDRRLASNLNYDETEFPVQENILARLSYKIIFI